jgi:hypothetical protein
MFKSRTAFILICVLSAIAFGCSAAKVTRAELEALKPGNIVVFRYDKDGKTWRYAEKITKIEGDTVYYYPSKYEGASGKDYKITTDFDQSRELSRSKAEYYKYETDQGEERRAIMWIE